jgi:signal transduction histidine kinase
MQNLEHIIKRIEQKKADFAEYDFDRREDDAFKAFFDLAQEFESDTDFNMLCVAVPKSYFGFDASLYLMLPGEERLSLVTSTLEARQGALPPMLPESVAGISDNGNLLIRIRGKKYLLDQLPFKAQEDVIGLLEIHGGGKLDGERKFYFVKYANRIGFSLHNRFLVEKNIRHLKFVRGLVADIEHNIIAPNIVYKLFMKNIASGVSRLDGLMELIEDLGGKSGKHSQVCDRVSSELVTVRDSINAELEEMGKHHRNMSMFLESLLRRSHFEQGRLTLRTKPCNMNRDVVLPQLDRFMERFHNFEIELDQQASGVPEEEVISVVDIGLMSQVYSNLFSNALKYAETVDTPYGRKKYISYGYNVVRDYFGEGRDGLKYNVFSTGSHMEPDDRHRLFDDRFRGKNSGEKPGTGHGLSFIRNVVEIHGGIAGYEPTEFGNNFYFILPADEAGEGEVEKDH